MNNQWSVFTKPWKTMDMHALADFVAGLGFDGIEFPLRSGFQVEPENAERDLPKLAQVLAASNLRIMSVASDPTEPVFAACQDAGVPFLRIMVKGDPSLSWWENLDATKKNLYSLLPLCEKYGVAVGVQQHHSFSIFNTMELRYLLDEFDPRYIGGIWDAAHSALAYEPPAKAFDIIWDKLLYINLKTAYLRPITGPEAPEAQFKPYFTTGPNGASSWSEVAAELRKRNYTGMICMPAEYTDDDNAASYIVKDFAYAKSLF